MGIPCFPQFNLKLEPSVTRTRSILVGQKLSPIAEMQFVDLLCFDACFGAD